jgi:hypothetical protein
MVDFFRTQQGKTLRVEETDEGMLSVHILKDGAWQPAPRGMIGLRLAKTTRRLTKTQIAKLPAER